MRLFCCKKIFIVFFAYFVFSFHLLGDVQVIKSYKQVKEEFDSLDNQALVIFDLDNTLVKTSKQLIEKDIEQMIHDLQERGVVVIALTARRKGQWSVTQLKNLGVTFTDRFEEVNKKVPYLEGILFSGNKGGALEHFLQMMEYQPSKILFFDDILKNITSVEKVLLKREQPHICYHYLGSKYAFLYSFNDVWKKLLETCEAKA